tara:strand:- start:226 stop:1062 length:837 start_codon:yes stop_codon:yes gene_type:complete
MTEFRYFLAVILSFLACFVSSCGTDPVEQHLLDAQTEANASVSHRISELKAYIDSRKRGAGPFAKDIVGWYGKWRAVKKWLPFTDSKGHERYVISKFNQHIFSNRVLIEQINKTTEACLKDLDEIENDLAVSLEEEILGRSLAPDEIPVATTKFKETIRKLAYESQIDAAKGIGKGIAAEVVTYVATQVLIELGVSAGILSAGAANSWWSLGGSLVVGGLIVWIWDWIDPPEAEIERKLVVELDELSAKVTNVMFREMNNIVTQRSEFWSEAAINVDR